MQQKREWKAWNLYLGSFRGLLSILSLPSRLELLLAVRYCSAGYLHKDEILLSLIYARFASNVTRSPAWIIDISLKYRVNIFGGSKVEISGRGFATIAKVSRCTWYQREGKKGRGIFLLFEPRGGNVAPPRIEKFNKRQYFPGNRSREGMIATRIPREKVSLSSTFLTGGGFVGTRSSRIVNFLERSVIRIHIFHFLS